MRVGPQSQAHGASNRVFKKYLIGDISTETEVSQRLMVEADYDSSF